MSTATISRESLMSPLFDYLQSFDEIINKLEELYQDYKGHQQSAKRKVGSPLQAIDIWVKFTAFERAAHSFELRATYWKRKLPKSDFITTKDIKATLNKSKARALEVFAQRPVLGEIQ